MHILAKIPRLLWRLKDKTNKLRLYLYLATAKIEKGSEDEVWKNYRDCRYVRVYKDEPDAPDQMIDKLDVTSVQVHSSVEVFQPTSSITLGSIAATGIPQPELPPVMIMMVADVHATAAEALGKLGDARAVEPLIAALEDTNEDVRNQAETALRRIGTPEALAAIQNHKE